MNTEIAVNFLENDKFEVVTNTSGITFYVDKQQDNYVPCGPNALELFLSSLGACIGVYAKRYFRRHAISFNECNIIVNAELSGESPLRLVDIKVRIQTDGQLSGNTEHFLRFIRACPIHNTIVATKDIDIEIA
jgi:uncharacterized OsmC-like protein